MGWAAKTPSLLQPSTPAADRGGEEVCRPLYRAAVKCLCLFSGSKINGNLRRRRRTSNQQSTSMAARESNKGRQSQWLWEHNNQPKDQLRQRHQQEWGQHGGGEDDSKGGQSRSSTAATTGCCGISSGEDKSCTAAKLAEATAARARAGAPPWQQQWQEQGRCGNDSCKDNSNGDVAREGNAVTWLDIVATVVARPAVTVVARVKDSAATTTEGYHGNGDGGDEDNSKGNSSENGECGGNSGGGASHLCLVFFFLVGLTAGFLLDT